MKKVFTAILIFSIIILTGCWDSREMNELGLVMAVGIDKASDSNNYIVTVQVVHSKQASQSGSETGSNTAPVFVLTAQGKTLFDATRELIKISSKRIMWAHNYIIIIGESVARDSIIPVIDYFTHNPELRMKTPVVVSKGKAMDYLTIKSGMEDITGITFSDIYGYAHFSAEFIETDLLSVSQNYNSEYAQPVISAIDFNKSRLILGDVISKEPVDQVQFGGSAVFQKDKMIGWLSPDETKGLAWIFNETGSTLETVPDPSNSKKFLSVETENVKTNIKTSVDDGKPAVTFEVSGTGSIVEEDNTTNLSLDELKKSVEGLVEKDIANNICMCLYKLQRVYASDVIGLARYVRTQHNDEWENGIKKQWKEIYPQMPVTVSVKININSSTIKQKPMNEVEKD